MQHNSRIDEEERKSVGIHKSTHIMLTAAMYDLRVPTYEDVIVLLVQHWQTTRKREVKE